MSLGNKIRYYRNRARLSQDELAQRIGVKKCTISRFEKDIRIPKIQTLKDIATATGHLLVIDFQKKEKI